MMSSNKDAKDTTNEDGTSVLWPSQTKDTTPKGVSTPTQPKREEKLKNEFLLIQIGMLKGPLALNSRH
jgi:hypothetical protein